LDASIWDGVARSLAGRAECARDIWCRKVSFRCVCSKAANIIDEMPHLLGSDSGPAVQAFHGGTEAIANIEEDLAIRRSVIPFVIGQIRRLRRACRGELLRGFAVAMSRRAVTFGTQAIVKSLAVGEGLRRRRNRVHE